VWVLDSDIAVVHESQEVLIVRSLEAEAVSVAEGVEPSEGHDHVGAVEWACCGGEGEPVGIVAVPWCVSG
jgi:hypothetical protein